MTPKGRILCTEDDPDTRDLLNIILTAEGYEVVCTKDADECLDLAARQQFDLYVLDHWMPKVSGLELTAELRAFDPRTPILFFSGVVRENEIRTAYEAGAQGYLIKPASPEKIVAEVKRLLAAAETPAYRHY